MDVSPVNDSLQTIHTGLPMKFQIDERDFGQGVKGLEDGQMGPSASSFLISGNCLGHNITIMSLTPCLKYFSEL